MNIAWPGLCNNRHMITTNLPELVHLLDQLGNVSVHDSMENIELRIEKPVDVHEVDDLVCDALFLDPIGRTEDQHGWTIRLWKRDDLRGPSDMRVLRRGLTNLYELQHAA